LLKILKIAASERQRDTEEKSASRISSSSERNVGRSTAKGWMEINLIKFFQNGLGEKQGKFNQ